MSEVTELFDRLSIWYWSPKFPTGYVVDNSGLGRVAFQCPPAFNLTWARYGLRLQSLIDKDLLIAEHQKAVSYFSKASSLTNLKLGSGELGEYLTLLSQKNFENWYKRKLRSTLPPGHVTLLDAAFYERV